MSTTSTPTPTTAAQGGLEPDGPDLPGRPTRRSRRGLPAEFKVNWWLTALLIVLSITILIPLYLTIVTALKTPAELGGSGFSLPQSPQWGHFAEAWELTNFPRAALNSAFVTAGAVVLTLLTNSMVAYALARNMHRRPFKLLFYYFVAALFVPFPILMLPVAKQSAILGLDNLPGLVLLYVVYGLSFNIFIFTAYINSIPAELEEAARVDGASTWTVFWRIIFPLMAPMNATVGILTCLWAWNDFLLPLIIVSDPGSATIPLVQYVFQSQFSTNYTVAFASYLMAMAPLLVVYIFAQRWVISGVTQGAIK